MINKYQLAVGSKNHVSINASLKQKNTECETLINVNSIPNSLSKGF